MRKTLLILLVILTVSLLATPAVVGWVAKEQSAGHLAALGAEYPGVTVTTEHFDRGWFESHSRHRLRMQPELLTAGPFADVPPFDLIIDSHYLHGPLPRRGDRPGLAQVRSVFTLADATTGESWPLPAQADTRMHLLGDATTHLTVEAFSWEPDEGYGGVDWDGGRLHLKVDSRLRALTLGVASERLRVRGPAGALDVEGLRVHVDQRRTAGGPWTGDGRAELDRLSLWTRERPRSSSDAHGLVVEFGTGQEDGLVDIDGRVALERLQWHGRQSRQLEVALHGERLQPTALRRVRALAQETVNDTPAAAPLTQRLRPTLAALLLPGPVLTLEQSGELPMGRTEAALEIRAPEFAVDNDPSLVQMLLQVEGGIQLQLPGELVDIARNNARAADATRLLLQTRLLVPDGQDYAMDLRYGQGQLTINNTPMPLPMEVVLQMLLGAD